MPAPAQPPAIETLLRVITALDEESRKKRARSHKRRVKARRVFLCAALAAFAIVIVLNASILRDSARVLTAAVSFILALGAGR